MRRGSGLSKGSATTGGTGSIGKVVLNGTAGTRVGEGRGEQEGVVMVVLIDAVDSENPEHAENAEDAEPDRKSLVLFEPRSANSSLNPDALGVAASAV